MGAAARYRPCGGPLCVVNFTLEVLGLKKLASRRRTPFKIFVEGDFFTKLSFLVWGLSNMVRGQIVKGAIYLALEIAYFYFMLTSGVANLANMMTLGTVEQSLVLDTTQGIMVVQPGDNSMLMLLYGVITIVITVMAVVVWGTSVYSGEDCRQRKLAGRKVSGILDDVTSLFDTHIVRLFLCLPLIGILIFTVTPLIYMILMAFTNYDTDHQPPGHLFSWVGLQNFQSILNASGKLGSTFLPILGWTMIWAVIACFSCYFGGMFLAILINSKGIRFKKMWRTIFIFAMAIPSFVSLLVINTMLGQNGIINVLLQKWGFSTGALPFLTNATWARCTVLVVNLWLGIPSTMMMVTGILMNIPPELYESAAIDGASPVQQFVSITFPYMLQVTKPYLITNFIGNINNFGVIYFLTGGAPNSLDYYKGAGKTDLLVTWLYKLTAESNDYNLAATIGILIFVISAVFSMITYAKAGISQNEEELQ